ncbi:MAG: TonB-dependent siderophore receptor [Acidobacteriota bacterium]
MKRAPARATRASAVGARGRAAWMATGTLVAYTALGGRAARGADAAEPPGLATPSAGGPGAVRTMPVRRFQIPQGPLSEVLRAFTAQTGVRVETSDPQILAMMSSGVSGIYTADLALKQLLAGMGLSHRFTSPQNAAVSFEAARESVEVTAPSAAVSSPKFTEPLLETPQSIDVVDREVMDERGTTTLRDALRNVAGISLAAGEGGAQGDNLTVRGFSARNDIFIDGVRDFGSYYRDPFDIQEVEVLKGPSSVTFGRGSTGGVVNQESKTPALERFAAGNISFGTDRTRRATADLEEPLPGLGTGAAFRLNVMANDSQVAGRDVAENRRFGIAPSLALGLGTATRVTAQYFHQSADDIPDYGIPWLFDAPAPVRRENYYGFRDANEIRTGVDIGTLRADHDFGDAVTVTNQTRYAKYSRDVQVTEARVLASVVPSTPIDQIIVNRNQIAVRSFESYFTDQLNVTGRFETGALRHTLVAGLEAGRETSEPVRFAFAEVPTTSLSHPDTSQPFTGTPSVTSRVHTEAVTYAAFVLDTVHVSEKWDLTAGLRWDRFQADYTQSVAPAAAFSRVDEMPSWRGAVVYKPSRSGSVYFDFGTSFNPSAESLALSTATAGTAPEKNRTFEVGTKWELSRGRLSFRAAIFRTEKTGAREPDPNNPLLNILAGNHRVDGFELDASGRVTDRWRVQASYALLGSEVISSRFYPASIGSPLANVPRHTLSVWNVYEFPWGLELGAGGQYVGARAASSTVPFDPVTGRRKEVPGYWTVDAMAKYPLSDRIALRLNVFNAGDREYFDQVHPAHIVPGPGRSALLGIDFRF